jgi:ABC-type maltose transport system permease subunit
MEKQRQTGRFLTKYTRYPEIRQPLRCVAMGDRYSGLVLPERLISIFLRDESRMTVPVGIQSFMQQYGTDWGSLMASATLAMVPTLILFLFVQKYLITGATAGAVKG